MRPASIVALLAIAQMSAAAPAPILQTIWQTATQVFNTDGSIYTVVDPLAQNAAPAAPTTTTPAPIIPATTSAPAPAPTTTAGSRFNLDSLLNDGKIQEWLDWLGLGSDSGSSSTASTSAAYVAPVTTSSAAPATTSKAAFWPTTSSASTASAAPSQDSGSIYADIYKASDIDTTFAKQILDSHNSYRAEHSTGPLSWDNDAYEYAKNNADSYDCSGVLTHTHGQYGENLAAGFANGPSAVKAWYDEGDYYNYQAANTYDHFTQVVWKGSTKVGCAYKDCSSTGWQKYIICSYDPPGNVIGQNTANVLPVSS